MEGASIGTLVLPQSQPARQNKSRAKATIQNTQDSLILVFPPPCAARTTHASHACAVCGETDAKQEEYTGHRPMLTLHALGTTTCTTALGGSHDFLRLTHSIYFETSNNAARLCPISASAVAASYGACRWHHFQPRWRSAAEPLSWPHTGHPGVQRERTFGFWTECSVQGPKGPRNSTRRWWCVRKCCDCRRNGERTCTLQLPSRIRSAVRIAAKSVRSRTHRELKGFVGISQTSWMRDQQGTGYFGWESLRRGGSPKSFYKA